MAVKIRLTRTGRKKLPSYRVVVADVQAPRDGRYIEKVGIYDPKENPPRFLIDEKQTLKWLHRGAQRGVPMSGGDTPDSSPGCGRGVSPRRRKLRRAEPAASGRRSRALATRTP